MRANEQRFINNALNNTAWAVVVDVGNEPRIDEIRHIGTTYISAYPLILASNENWQYLCNRLSNFYGHGMVFFHYDTKILRWKLDTLYQLSVESFNSCWASVWEDQNPRVLVGDMFIVCTNGAPLSMRFLHRIEKHFLTIYKDVIANALKQYNVPISKSLKMKMQEVTIL